MKLTANTMTGFFIGPLYPVGLCVLIQVVPRDIHIGALGMYTCLPTLPPHYYIETRDLPSNTGFSASLGQAGSAAFPFLTGAVASRAGVQVLQPIMVALLVAIAVFWALVPRKGSA